MTKVKMFGKIIFMGINIEYLKKLYAEKKKKRLRVLSEVRTKVVKAIKPFNPSRVYIFGSLVKDTWDERESDIDIAIEGVKWERMAEMDKAMRKALHHDHFDIVLMEYAGDPLLLAISYEGELIYEG